MENFIDVSEIKNCWVVYLKPFDSETRKWDFGRKYYPEHCIDKKIFGMGWNGPKIEKLYSEIVNEIKQNNGTYTRKYKRNDENSSCKNCIWDYMQIRKGDLVITRLEDNYYLGRVSKEKTRNDKGIDILQDEYLKSKGINLTENERKLNIALFSYYCEVEEWLKFKERDLPGDIVGFFSMRNHSTIQRKSDLRIKLLMIKLFQEHKGRNGESYTYIDKNENIEKELTIPKIVLNKNNFVYALNPKDLEDVVCEYILIKNEDYRLLPSQCKINKVKYEFDLFNKEDYGKVITCQVKNQQPVLYTEYEEDIENFEKIYLFSGKDEYCSEKDKEDVKAKIEKAKKSENEKIIIITADKLFDEVLKDKNSYISKKLLNSGFYDINNDESVIMEKDYNSEIEGLKYDRNFNCFIKE